MAKSKSSKLGKAVAPETPFRRKNRRLGDHTHNSSSTWLVSFTDVMALMLTFFVLLFAMSNTKQEDWENFTRKIQENFNRYEGPQLYPGNEDTISIDKISFSRALSLNYLEVLTENLIAKEPSLAEAKIINTGNSLIIALPSELLFEPSKAVVKSQANKALYTLATSLSRVKNRIEVVGHTDPRPINDSDFPSNWELSLTRASNVAAILESFGYDNKVTIRGQASGRYDDIPETVPENVRLDLSRRVDIVIMEDDGRRRKLFDIGLPELPK